MSDTPSVTPPSTPYQVLARKYRPQSFDDLLGHEAMVRTLRNAFAAGRIAHAFILTGVRGVGKTTTARIMARALNYQDDETDRPTVDMGAEGFHCRAIAESRHPDVIEMDAASRTGVGDIRELIEGVRYAPVEGRYKVYIIDEVHMLTNNAFNALLKTLEEPPPHVKFIFATTEIRKVPVTVLSRCQRFDLRRFDPETLSAYLQGIAEKEGASVSAGAMEMIARAAEGSVRDALSLLDQAIVQHAGTTVGDEAVRDMLGLVDRTRMWDILGAAMKGDAPTALSVFRDQYNAGADPGQVVRDLLDITHLLTRTKAAGDAAAADGIAGEADAARARTLAGEMALPALTRTWSLLMQALSEVQAAPEPAGAAEIGLIRIAYAAEMPTPDEALRLLREKSGPTGEPGRPQGVPPSGGGGAVAMARRATVPSPVVQVATEAAPGPSAIGLEDIAQMAKRHREAHLRTLIETCIRPIHVSDGRLDMALTLNAPQDFPGALSKALKAWTGRPWMVSIVQDPGHVETLREARDRLIAADPDVQKLLKIFPEGKITAVRDMERFDGEET